MKMKIKRTVVSLVVCIALASSLMLGASAQDFLDVSSNNGIILTRVSEMMPLIFERDFSENDHVVLGDRLFVYRIGENGDIVSSDYESYPLIVNNEVIGIVDVSRNDHGNVSQVSLGEGYAPELQNFICENDNVAFSIIHTKDGVYIKRASDQTVFCLDEYIDTAIAPVISESTLLNYAEVSECTVLDSIAKPNATLSRSTSDVLFNTLDVHNVANTSTSCCPGGICWAASIAIMANYHIGTSYDALDVHDMCGCLTDNYHSEEKAYIRQLGMYPGGPYYSSGNLPFCFSTLYDCIEADMLLLLDFQDYEEEVAHNVVGYGYYASTSSSAMYFYYMDPNTGGRISSFPDSVSDPVYVSLDGYNYEVHCYITAYR